MPTKLNRRCSALLAAPLILLLAACHVYPQPWNFGYAPGRPNAPDQRALRGCLLEFDPDIAPSFDAGQGYPQPEHPLRREVLDCMNKQGWDHLGKGTLWGFKFTSDVDPSKVALRECVAKIDPEHLADVDTVGYAAPGYEGKGEVRDCMRSKGWEAGVNVWMP